MVDIHYRQPESEGGGESPAAQPPAEVAEPDTWAHFPAAAYATASVADTQAVEDQYTTSDADISYIVAWEADPTRGDEDESRVIFGLANDDNDATGNAIAFQSNATGGTIQTLAVNGGTIYDAQSDETDAFEGVVQLGQWYDTASGTTGTLKGKIGGGSIKTLDASYDRTDLTTLDFWAVAGSKQGTTPATESPIGWVYWVIAVAGDLEPIAAAIAAAYDGATGQLNKYNQVLWTIEEAGYTGSVIYAQALYQSNPADYGDDATLTGVVDYTAEGVAPAIPVDTSLWAHFPAGAYATGSAADMQAVEDVYDDSVGSITYIQAFEADTVLGAAAAIRCIFGLGNSSSDTGTSRLRHRARTVDGRIQVELRDSTGADIFDIAALPVVFGGSPHLGQMVDRSISADTARYSWRVDGGGDTIIKSSYDRTLVGPLDQLSVVGRATGSTPIIVSPKGWVYFTIIIAADARTDGPAFWTAYNAASGMFNKYEAVLAALDTAGFTGDIIFAQAFYFGSVADIGDDATLVNVTDYTAEGTPP